MATFVEDTRNSVQFVLIGSGFGAYQSTKPHWFFGDAHISTEEGSCAMVCVCNCEGKIGWLDSSHVVVVSVDGEPVESLFSRINEN